jgi:multiple sugar transport system substrate-binding protein
MTELRQLRGMTWDHSRGFDPMQATALKYGKMNPGVEITWGKRSLQAFADRPIAEMANRFDMMVIDHPHVGEVAGSGLLVAFDQVGREREIETLANQSVGPSHASYQFNGHQWGLAIDAASPVAVFRPDRLEKPPKRWSEVLELAREGQVAFALIPINALMVFLGMVKNLEMPVADEPHRFIAPEDGTRVLEEMCNIVSMIAPRCLELDPIGILEWMGRCEDGPAYSPFGYGYTNYSRSSYCPYPLVFADAPGFGGRGPGGTVIGGTGIAVSSLSKHQSIAIDYAFWIASADCQKGLFYDSGGQPANAVAWENNACNVACRNFFRNTRATLESSWLRPRYAGYMGFQDAGGELVHTCLRGEATITDTLAALDNAYRESRK